VRSYKVTELENHRSVSIHYRAGRASITLAATFLTPPKPRVRAVQHPNPAIHAPAPSSSRSIAVKPTTRSAIFLEHHLGAVVGACAGAIAEATQEFQSGKLTLTAKLRSGEYICELYRLRQFMISDFPNFDTIAKERGVEMLRACNVSAGAANLLVDAVLEILAKIVRDQAN